jgi:hypothetical protein
LYDPAYEHAACGVAIVADLAGRRDHGIVRKALTALHNLEHRGARGGEPDTGDGAGILIQVPDGFFRQIVDFELPESGRYAVGTAFLPSDDAAEAAAMAAVEDIAAQGHADAGLAGAAGQPWDGPALVAFTDGTVIGAVLDRNGLRPARYWVTEDGLVVLASEVGVLDIDPATVVRKGRLEPGRMFLADTAAGRIVGDDEIKGRLAAEHPYAVWVAQGLTRLADLPGRDREVHTHASLVRRQQTLGYTQEELGVLLAPMARTGAEPIGSMGNDAPLAPFSRHSRPLFDYFTQLFAQVTNPPRWIGHLGSRGPGFWERTGKRIAKPEPVVLDLVRARAGGRPHRPQAA